MKLYEVEYNVTYENTKFKDSIVLPAKTKKDAEKLFASLPSFSKGLMGTWRNKKILYLFEHAKLEVTDIVDVTPAGTRSTGPK